MGSIVGGTAHRRNDPSEKWYVGESGSHRQKDYILYTKVKGVSDSENLKTAVVKTCIKCGMLEVYSVIVFSIIGSYQYS